MTSYFVHDTALVDPGAEIGDSTKIWHWSHVSSGAKIGKKCILGQNTFVGNNAVIGNCVKVQNNVSVYDGVVLSDNVFCGPSVVFTNVINPRSFIERKNEFKKTFVKENASIGANSTIVCGVTVGFGSFIGAGSVVTKDVKDFALVVGNPAVQKGWMTLEGHKIDLPLTGTSMKWICSVTNDIYLLNNDQITRHPPGLDPQRKIS